MPMKREIRDKWVAYLKGKRKAREKLYDAAGGKCCFGHLMAMCGKTKEDMSNETGSLGLPPMAFLHEIGMPISDMNALVELNDTKSGFPIEAIKKLPVR